MIKVKVDKGNFTFIHHRMPPGLQDQYLDMT